MLRPEIAMMHPMITNGAVGNTYQIPETRRQTLIQPEEEGYWVRRVTRAEEGLAPVCRHLDAHHIITDFLAAACTDEIIRQAGEGQLEAVLDDGVLQ